MATEYIDGNIILDSFSATIATQTYIFNNGTINIPIVEAERNGVDGTLAAKRAKDDLGRATLTAEIQISESAQNQKLLHETFDVPANVHPDGTATTYVIESESTNFAANESRTRSITARRSITAN